MTFSVFAASPSPKALPLGGRCWLRPVASMWRTFIERLRLKPRLNVYAQAAMR